MFDSSFKNRREFIGTDDTIDFGTALYGIDGIILHNHPRNSSYSFRDIVEFIASDSMKTFTIIKNNGAVEILTKLNDVDKKSLLIELRRLEKNNVKLGIDSEYRKIIDKFLGKCVEGGILEWKKKGI